MSEFKLHTIESAPEEARPLLEKSQKNFGMHMADTPVDEPFKDYTWQKSAA